VVTASEARRKAAVCPVDGHVHFHRLELVPLTLDAAASNFRRISSSPAGVLGALLLTQASGERVFEQIKVSASVGGGWRVEPASRERQSILAHRDGATIAIVCGRQVRARGGLEVLGLGTSEEFPDGESLVDTVAAVHNSGAATVLPWGFGKWLGERGRLVRDALHSAGVRVLSVGDNGSRLAGLAVPALIREAEREGFRVIPGTDPFPFGRDYRRVGRFGFLAEVDIDEEAPWESLRAWLEALPESPPRFGSASGPVRFVVNQVGIQFYNRLWRRSGT
jgi:hypothetical protein